MRASADTVLYNGALATDPAAQGWTGSLSGATETLSGGAVTLDTLGANTARDNAIHAGYARTTPFALDRMQGYDVHFDVQVNGENHDGSDKNGDGKADRAGFSLIVLGSDKKGLELAFWTDQIWPQEDNPLFTHPAGSEFAAFDTTQAGKGHAGLIGYDLQVRGNAYTLFADGSSTALLSGNLRDYSGASFPASLVYNQTNFLFLGDDTGSARARARISYVGIQAVPESDVWRLWGGLLLGGAGLALLHRRRRAGRTQRPA